MSTAEHPDALARRREQPPAGRAEVAVEGPREAELVAPLVQALRSELGALRTELASARAESGAALQELAAELAGTRRELAAQSAASSAAQGLREGVQDATGEQAAAASSTAVRLQALTAAVDGLRRDLDDVGTGLVSATSELVSELRARSAREAEHLRTSLEAVRTGFDARAAELSAALSRGLLDLAEEVDVATTTTRDAASRVTVLAELTESQREGVERLLRDVQADVVDAGQGLREELRARTASLLGELGARLHDVETRLTGLDGTVAGGAVAAERAAAGLDVLTATTDHLDATVDGFRTEWPTRTYEVVEGARAVAEGVVLDVRAEVGARLEDVRAVLERVVGTVDLARAGLHDGTDRLAEAGTVLVAYLEHRDRLLEAERDRVLHDVLDAFAAGLSSRDRGALAGRVADAVVRRRDARDAERYRSAVGEPVAPTAELPDHVRRLGERVPERPPPEQPEAAVEREPAAAPVHAAVPAAAPEAPGRGPARPRVARRPGSGGAAVVPGPGRAAPTPGHDGGG